MQRPCKRLKLYSWKYSHCRPITIFSTHTYCFIFIDQLQPYTSKVAKIVVRHKIVSLRVEGYVSQQSSTPEKPKGKLFPWVETSQKSPCLAVKRLDWIRSRTALLKVCHHFLPLLHYKWSWYWLFSFSSFSSSFVESPFMCTRSLQAKNSNGTTVRTFSYFNL